MVTVIERVRAGATLLDATVPGWAGKIDVDALDIEDCVGCILGQTFADATDEHNEHDFGYNAGCRILDIGEGMWSQSAAFGFHYDSDGMDKATFGSLSLGEKCRLIDQWSSQQHPALRSAWLHEIALRLETPSAEEARIEALPVATYACPL